MMAHRSRIVFCLSLLLLAPEKILITPTNAQQTCSGGDINSEQCIETAVANVLISDEFHTSIAEATGCGDAPKEGNSYYDCLGDSILNGDALSLINLFLSGDYDMATISGSLNYLGAALDLLDVLNPFVGAGLEILSFLFAQDSEDNYPPWVDDVMERFDVIDRKMKDIKQQIGDIGDEIVAIICLETIQDEYSVINTARGSFDVLREVYNQTDRTYSQKQADYKAAEIDFISDCTSVREAIQNIVDDYGAGDSSVLQCAKKLQNYVGNKSKVYFRSVVVPALAFVQNGIELMGYCTIPAQVNRAKKLYKLLEKEFEERLNSTDKNWMTDNASLEKINEGIDGDITADKVHDILMNDWAYNYHFSVVVLTFEEDRNDAYGKFPEPRESNGMVPVKPSNSSGKDILIYYRKDDIQGTYGRRWPFRWNNYMDHCTDRMCISTRYIFWFIRECYAEDCGKAQILLQTPEKKNNLMLQNELKWAGGVALVKTHKIRKSCGNCGGGPDYPIPMSIPSSSPGSSNAALPAASPEALDEDTSKEIDNEIGIKECCTTYTYPKTRIDVKESRHYRLKFQGIMNEGMISEFYDYKLIYAQYGGSSVLDE